MQHRRAVRPRWGRITALAASLLTTLVAVLAGAGAFPSAADTGSSAVLQLAEATLDAESGPEPDPAWADEPAPRRLESPEPDPAALPSDSGEGRRAVFSESQQRVWIVGAQGRVKRTYLVSGSTKDNLDPGTYEVYSRSMDAIGVDDSGTMRYFVRFLPQEGGAIGFHDIPVKDGEQVQTRSQLGTPLSHGCIRQKHADAVAMWEFAQLGTTVVVV